MNDGTPRSTPKATIALALSAVFLGTAISHWSGGTPQTGALVPGSVTGVRTAEPLMAAPIPFPTWSTPPPLALFPWPTEDPNDIEAGSPTSR